MVTRIKNLLAPPVFQGDELKTRQASLLNLVLLSLFVLAILMFLGNALSTEAFTRTRMIGNVFLAACCIGLSAWMRRGNVQAAGILTLVLSFVLLTTSVALRGTIRTQNMALFFWSF